MGGVVGGIVGTIGGLISGGKAADAAKGQAEALRAAADRASGMARFNPIGIRTGFGQSQFQLGPDGRLTSAGYTLDPRLLSLQNRLLGGATAAPRAITTQVPQLPQGYSLEAPAGYMGTAVIPREGFTYAYSPTGERIEVPLTTQTTYEPTTGYDPTRVQQLTEPLYGGVSSLFNLGQSYLGQTPQDVASRFMSQRQALLAPSREAQFAGLQARNFARGTGGLGVQTGTGTAPANPALQAYFNAIARQDQEIAAQAEQEARQQIQFGGELYGAGSRLAANIPSLFSTSFLPIETQLALARTTESMGQQPFQLSQELARLESGIGAQAGQLYLQPQEAAARSYAQYQGYSPMGSFLSSLGPTISGGGGLFSNPNQYGGLFGGGRVPTSSSGFESWESPYIS